jgi:tetratricopeptide (TPR) repeat protein
MKICLFRALLCSIVVALMFSGCGRKPSQKAGAKTAYFKTSFQDESAFIVETVLVDLAELVVHAKAKATDQITVSAVEKKGSPLGKPTYHVEIACGAGPVFKTDLTVDGPIWSPAVYSAVATNFARHIGFASGKAVGAAPELAEKLIGFEPTAFEAENQRISALLTKEFSSPDLHEQAALLLGAFGLREYSAYFYDIRSLLCRMTSHLTFANLLRGGSKVSADGQLADAVLFLLMNNQRTALEKLSALDKTSPPMATWDRALRARITCDYRELDSWTNRTGVESAMHFHAVTHAIGPDAAFKKVGESAFRKSVDFTRIVNGTDCSVGLGHQLLRGSLSLELAEAAAVYKAFHAKELAAERVVAELNHLPQRCVTKGKVRVIDWGRWAQSLQRHLCMAISTDFEFMEYSWGVPAEAGKFSAEMKRLFGGLRLYPFVAWITCTDERSYRAAVDAAMRVTVEIPHLVAPRVWNKICMKKDSLPLYLPNPNPHVNEWHKHNPPPGTAYNLRPRMNHPSLTKRRDTPQLLTKLHELAPYDFELSYHMLELKFKDKATYEEVVDLYAPVLDYSSVSIHNVASRVSNLSDKYEELMTRAVAMDSSYYGVLGDYYLCVDQPQKAIIALEKAVEHNSDTVAAVSRSPWMVRYYFDRGLKDKARDIADMGSRVYSYAGLEAQALYFELSGKYPLALDWYQKIEERYGAKDEVAAFYARYKAATGDKKYDAAAEKILRRLFPLGIQRVTLKSFTNRPGSGVLVQEDSVLLKKAGLAKGDVVVALYGTRVNSWTEYNYVRKTRHDPEMDLIVWKPAGQFIQTKASPPEHRFGVEMTSYPAR